MAPLRIALINDYEVVVRGLATMLRAYQDRIKVVELDMEAPVGTPVDIALYDTFAAQQGDRQGAHDLTANPLVGKVAVYSWVQDPGMIQATLANGVSGYISKGIPARHLVTALEEIHLGKRNVFTGEDGSSAVLAGDWPGREEGLTQREAEVLALITQGLSNDEIAVRAHLSRNSVKTYIRNCYRRINVSSRTNAVLWGIEHGFRPDRGQLRPAADGDEGKSPR